MPSNSTPKTIKQTLYILQDICPNSWDESYRLTDLDLTKLDTYVDRYVLLGTHEVEVAIPTNVNPAALAIAGLEKKRDAVREDMMRQISVIDERIESIRCIEYKPESASDER